MKVMMHFPFLLTLFVLVRGTDIMERAATSPATTPEPVAHLTAVTNQLTTTVSQLSTKLNTLNSDLGQKAGQITSLNNQIRHQSNVIRNLTNQLSQKAKQLSDLDSYCKSHVTDLTNRVQTLEHPVAFTARFSNDSVGTQFIPAGSWQNLVFDVVSYQTGGNNYNTTNGRFTAPSAGTYAFFLSVQRNNPDQNDCLEATVRKNGNFNIVTATACPPGFTSASNMGMAYMRAGDTAYVRTDHSEIVFGFVHTSFSVVKLGRN